MCDVFTAAELRLAFCTGASVVALRTLLSEKAVDLAFPVLARVLEEVALVSSAVATRELLGKPILGGAVVSRVVRYRSLGGHLVPIEMSCKSCKRAPDLSTLASARSALRLAKASKLVGCVRNLLVYSEVAVFCPPLDVLPRRPVGSMAAKDSASRAKTRRLLEALCLFLGRASPVYVEMFAVGGIDDAKLDVFLDMAFSTKSTERMTVMTRKTVKF